MSSLGLRVGRLALPRMGASVSRTASKGQLVIPAHLIRMVNVQQQQQARSLVLCSSRCAQAQVQQAYESNSSGVEGNAAINSPDAQLDKNLYKMDMELRKFGRIRINELDEAIQFIRRRGVCSSTQALLLLRFCGNACTDDSKQDRRKRVEELISTLYSITKLDVSHFNAILKLHMDNGEKVEVSKFLTDMEGAGCLPNRVTYNYLIGLYCMEGNITGATTVLEQMKEEGMAINESVFHSLLYGHVYNKDKESTNETLDIMANSNLLPGAETYTWMLQAAAKVQDWDRVEELLQEAVEKEIRLDAGDHFKLLVSLCESGMGAKAETLTEKIPRQMGYFQEMRNSLPAIIFAGNAEMAFQLYEDFANSVGANGNKSAEQKRTDGIFFTNILVKSNVEPEKAAEMVMKLYDNGQTQQLKSFVMRSIESDRRDYIQALHNEMSKRPEENKVQLGDMTNFVILQGFKSLSECAMAMKDVQSVGCFVQIPKVARAMINHNYDSNTMTPAALFNYVASELKDISFATINNQLILHLLSKNTPQANQELNGFLLNTPARFNATIVKHSLVTNAHVVKSTDVIINILFKLKLNNSEDSTEKNEEVYRDIFMALTEEKVLINVMKNLLKDLNNYKIGVPRAVADQLTEKLEDSEIKDLFAQAVKDYEDDSIWTTESIQQFLELRKQNHKEENKRLGLQAPVPESRRYQGNNFPIPEDLNGMFAIKKIIAKRGDTNLKLENNIIKGLAAADKPGEAVLEMEEVMEKVPSFGINPTRLDDVVNSFNRLNKPEEAWEFFNKYGSEHFHNTIINICASFAKKGNHDKVLEILRSFPMEGKKTINLDFRRSVDILKVYANAGDVDKVEETFQVLEEKITNKGLMKSLLPPLVEVHLNRDDMNGALAAFEKYARKYRFCPARDALMTRLVQEENVDDLQKCIDLSISVAGEELTLYSLTYIFLLQERRSQAKKMLETPGLMYNLKEFNRMMQLFVKQGRLDCLEDLVVMSKNVFGCDRDHLFYFWVKAEANNIDKIEEIWMQIQDEGHAPSVDLKTEVARAFTKAGKQVPFDTTDLVLAVAQPVKVQEVAMETPKKTTKKIKEKKRIANTEKVATATMTDEESDKFVQSLKSETLTDKERHAGVDQLIKAGRLEQAGQVLADNDYRLKIAVRNLITRLSKTNQREVLEKFIESMPQKHRNYFKPYEYLNPFHPSKIVEKVRAASEDNLVLMDSNIVEVNKAVKEDPSIKKDLESLASSGHLPAVIMLGKLAALETDAEALVRYWNMDTREEKKGYCLNMKNFDQLRFLCDTLNNDAGIVNAATKVSLLIHPEKTREILEFSLQRGLDLSTVLTSALKKALALDDFPHKDEIESILKQREEKKEKQES